MTDDIRDKLRSAMKANRQIPSRERFAAMVARGVIDEEGRVLLMDDENIVPVSARDIDRVLHAIDNPREPSDETKRRVADCREKMETGKPPTVTSAHGVTGHILNTRNDGSYVFRVYGGVNPETGRKAFVDYRLAFDDLLITIADPRAKLVRDGTGDRLVDYQGEG